MEIVRALLSVDLAEWLERRSEEGVPLRWFGTAAKVLGLKGKADPEMVRQVLCDGLGPNGERLGNPLRATYQLGDGTTYTPDLMVAYALDLRPHETVRALAEDSHSPEELEEAHRVAVGEALEAMEESMDLELVGVVATSHHEPSELRSEVVFAASGRYWGGDLWQPLDAAAEVFNLVLPAARAALVNYQRRLGQEVAGRFCAKVIGVPSLDTSLPIAVGHAGWCW